MTDTGMMDYAPLPLTERLVRPAAPQRMCQGDACERLVDYDKTHRVEAGDTKLALCDWCCPNCFGGEGHGPSGTT